MPSIFPIGRESDRNSMNLSGGCNVSIVDDLKWMLPDADVRDSSKVCACAILDRNVSARWHDVCRERPGDSVVFVLLGSFCQEIELTSGFPLPGHL
jgi:hypothetical protein